MKRCPKCNRTFPDENQKFCTVDGGLLIAAQPAFDPNMTIRATSADLNTPETPDQNATSRDLPDPSLLAATASASAPTVAFPRPTGPTGKNTSSDLPNAPAPGVNTLPGNTPIPKKRSKLPWILGALALVLLLGLGGLAGLFFFVIKPRLGEFTERRVAVTEPNGESNTNTNSNTNSATTTENNNTTAPEAPEFVPPAGTVKFENSKDHLDGKLAEHYLGFSFYYPESWEPDPKAGVPGASNFAKVERRLPPDFTQENFAVGWYTSKGTFEADRPGFPKLVESFSNSLSKNFPEYRKVSEGPTKINSMDGYEFRFVSLSKGTEKGDLQLWGRVVFLPTGNEGETTGATLVMLSTSLAPELSGVEDVGKKGEMPVILESFRFAKG
jgi:hypothetical protein